MKFNLQSAGLKALLLPGGPLLAFAFLLGQGGLSAHFGWVIEVCYYAAFVLGLILAWRFHSSRVFSALIVLLLAQQAVAFFISQGHGLGSGLGLTALEVVTFLVPLNFAVLAFSPEEGIDVPSLLPFLVLLFLQSVFVAVICRPAPTSASTLFHAAFLNKTWFSWTKIPQIAWLAFLIVAVSLIVRAWQRPRPVESGFLWALATFFFGMNAGVAGATAKTYIGMSAVILVASIIETSYAMAYRDELTGLPSRRAFNDAKLKLEAPYAIAGVDIDHFKSVNDTFGHETGDDVLCLVASRLARVGGGGQAYRVGGEEFTILFPGKTADDVMPDLEDLRGTIENSVFHLRGSDRRTQPRGPDRRSTARKTSRPRTYPSSRGQLRVTVSIGVAEPSSAESQVEDVIRLADQGLYRAKKSGRNRIEMGVEERRRTRSKRKSSAN